MLRTSHYRGPTTDTGRARTRMVVLGVRRTRGTPAQFGFNFSSLERKPTTRRSRAWPPQKRAEERPRHLLAAEDLKRLLHQRTDPCCISLPEQHGRHLHGHQGMIVGRSAHASRTFQVRASQAGQRRRPRLPPAPQRTPRAPPARAPSPSACHTTVGSRNTCVAGRPSPVI